MDSHFPIHPPLGRAFMRDLRLKLKRMAPSAGVGAHLRRKGGQSLEFREFRSYNMGDDIRKVDWLASLRTGRVRDRIVRVFEAEEQLTLLVVVDARPAMFLPESAPKIIYALWSALCLVEAALAEGDKIVLGTMFHPLDPTPLVVSGPSGRAKARVWARRVIEQVALKEDWHQPNQARLSALRKTLEPACITVVLSDLLFEDPTRAIGSFFRDAQMSYRELVLAELDSWPMERALLQGGPVKLSDIEGRTFPDDLLEIPETLLEEADRNMAEHRQQAYMRWRKSGLSWPRNHAVKWPETIAGESFESFFKASFPEAAFLRSVVAR